MKKVVLLSLIGILTASLSARANYIEGVDKTQIDHFELDATDASCEVTLGLYYGDSKQQKNIKVKLYQGNTGAEIHHGKIIITPSAEELAISDFAGLTSVCASDPLVTLEYAGAHQHTYVMSSPFNTEFVAVLKNGTRVTTAITKKVYSGEPLLQFDVIQFQMVQ